MAKRDIIVIGASAGGIDAFKKLVRGLPEHFSASIFIVWHTAPNLTSFLPRLLDRETAVPVVEPFDGERIVPGTIYVAIPDHHLLIEDGLLRVTKGPKENRFRPAVDPLFRSAAEAYGPRVIGVIMSGGLDDGTAGLWTVKSRGGIAVVQDPVDAEFPSMPISALREVQVDYTLPATKMGELLVRLTNEEIGQVSEVGADEKRKTSIEVKIAAGENPLELGIMELGEPSPITCPDCNGTLLKLKDGRVLRFRCHTGHAYSADTLLSAISEQMEKALWNAIRVGDESLMLLDYTAKELEGVGHYEIAGVYRQKADEIRQRMEQVRDTALQSEELSDGKLRTESAYPAGAS
jgi:two-component system chemotaxis response regulator CheB